MRAPHDRTTPVWLIVSIVIGTVLLVSFIIATITSTTPTGQPNSQNENGQVTSTADAGSRDAHKTTCPDDDTITTTNTEKQGSPFIKTRFDINGTFETKDGVPYKFSYWVNVLRHKDGNTVEEIRELIHDKMRQLVGYYPNYIQKNEDLDDWAIRIRIYISNDEPNFDDPREFLKAGEPHELKVSIVYPGWHEQLQEQLEDLD